MYRFYEKSQENFSLVLILAYVVLFSAADNLSAAIGIRKIITAPVAIAMTAVIYFFLRSHGLREKYGLCRFRGDFREYLYFLPLAALVSTNLWAGVEIRSSILEAVLHVVTMLAVGFLEEIIFRGFLFLSLDQKNRKQAVVISSLTFGIGHVVNLLNGAELIPTLLQICYAVAIGFLFTILFLRSGSLWPCILTHSAVNSLSAFGGEGSMLMNLLASLFLCAVSLFYAFWILKKAQKL